MKKSIKFIKKHVYTILILILIVLYTNYFKKVFHNFDSYVIKDIITDQLNTKRVVLTRWAKNEYIIAAIININGETKQILIFPEQFSKKRKEILSSIF